jgi:tRNA U34 2-thiouridine synthase MnmA/TrmU
MEKKSALVLTSGGLDSLLTCKLLLESGIEVTGLVFKSLFFGSSKGKKACQQLEIPYIIKDVSEPHLEIVKQPVHGSGKGLNPCIDCHLFMAKKAKEIMDQEGFDFVATGDVLGQRSFSQRKKVLQFIRENSGLKDLLVRPLSAQLLKKTIPEKKSWIDKKSLLSITGASRRKQIKFAEKFGLDYPTPAGGCMLAEPKFAEKLQRLFNKWPDCRPDDVCIIKIGRKIWQGKTLFVVGRNEEENKRIKQLSITGDQVIMPENFPGPTTLIRRGEKDDLDKAKQFILKYSNKAKRKGIKEQFIIRTI